MTSLPEKIRFGVFDLDTRSGELRRQGSKIRLPHQSFQILIALLERPGALVTREELRQRLWPGETFVNFDTGISSALKKLRAALADSAESPRFVETLPKHGYRFIAPVNPVNEDGRSVARPNEGDSAPAQPADQIERLGQPDPDRVLRRRRMAVIVGAALVLLASAAAVLAPDLGRWREGLWNRVHPPRIRSLAVLPLENLTGDPAQDGLVEAVTDSLTTELVRSGLVDVASRASAGQFAGLRIGIPQIARRLQVDAVVEGTVTQVGDQWLLNVQLIQCSLDRHVWAQRYVREQGEIAALPREMAWEMLRAIPPRLQPQNERGEARRRPANEEAYAAYVLGRHFLGMRTRPNVEKAIGHFQRAVLEDPGYGPAYSGLSDAYRIDTMWDIRPETLQKAEAAARKALDLDGNLAEAHTSLGGVLWRRWKWDDAESELRRALELDPDYAEGYRAYGTFLMMLRRNEEAIAALRRAHEIDRLSSTISVEYAGALTHAGRYDEALHELERARDLDPKFWRTYQGMAFVHAAKGDWTRAISALELFPHPSAPSARRNYAWLGYYFAAAGRRAEALEILHNIEGDTTEYEGKCLSLGIVQLGLGDKEKALDLLERGIREQPANLSYTTILYDLLKDEPRYQATLREMGLDLSEGESLRAEPAREHREQRPGERPR